MPAASDVIAAVRKRFLLIARITPNTAHAKKFLAFGEASAIAYPPTEIFGEEYIEIATGSLFGPRLTLTAGMAPGHVLPAGPAVSIGHRCVIGQGAGIVGMSSITIGNDVWTGHNVYITDFNHGYEDITTPPGQQFSKPRPVVIDDGVWIGNGSTILGGSIIGKNCVIGAGSVVTGPIPDYSVAVGVPARVIRQYLPERGWFNPQLDQAEPTVEPAGTGELTESGTPRP